MQFQITSDNIEMSPSMMDLAHEKLSKLDKHLKDTQPDSKSVRVVLNSGPEGTFFAKVEAEIKGNFLFAEEKGYTLEQALVNAVANVNRQYLKLKTKR